MRRSANKTRSPYLTIARFDGKCAETGKAIRKGEPIAYDPSTGKVYADESNRAGELRAMQFAAAYGMPDANY